MATDKEYAEFVCDQLKGAGGVSARKMFGEYGLYRHGKIVGLICDNQLFIKPTPAGERVLGTPSYGEPYPGAKPYFSVSDLLDDPPWLVQLVQATDGALPPARAKKVPSAGGTKPASKAAPAGGRKKPAPKK